MTHHARLQELQRKYNKVLYKHAYNMCGNRELSEDLVQDTWVRAFRALDHVKPDGNVQGWLMRITTRLFLDYKRMCARRPIALSYDNHRLSDNDDDMTYEQADDTNWVDKIIDRIDHEQTLREAERILERSFDPIEVAMLKASYDDAKYSELAQIACQEDGTPLPIGTTRSRLHRLRKRIAKIADNIAREKDGDSDAENAPVAV